MGLPSQRCALTAGGLSRNVLGWSAPTPPECHLFLPLKLPLEISWVFLANKVGLFTGIASERVARR